MASLLDPLTIITTFSSSSPPNFRKPLHHSPPQLVLATSKHGNSMKLASSRIHMPSNHFLISFKPRAARRTNGIVCEASETSLVGSVPAVTDHTWESQVLKADCPVLVEFWAPWCGPCRMLHPVVGELSKQYAGRVNCFQLNTDDHPSIATQYGIRSIPTIMIFVNGVKKDAILGAVPKTTIAASLEKFL